MAQTIELTCSHCDWTQECGPTAMLSWLRAVHMARRQTEPDAALLAEVFRAAAGRFQCPSCGAVGLTARNSQPLDDEQWGQARACAACGRPIDRARLEALPQARLCVACQGRADRGQDDAPAEYCPRCGAVMRLATSSRGVTRYRLVCSGCGR